MILFPSEIYFLFFYAQEVSKWQKVSGALAGYDFQKFLFDGAFYGAVRMVAIQISMAERRR